MLKLMNDKEALSNIVLWDDVVKENQSGATNTSKSNSNSNQGDISFDMSKLFSPVANNTTVLQYAQEIRDAANNNEIFIIDGSAGNSGSQPVSVSGGGSGGGGGGSGGGILISTDHQTRFKMRDIHKIRKATHIG